MRVGGNYDRGIIINGKADVTIRNCRVVKYRNGAKHGITISASHDVLVESSRIKEFEAYGVRVLDESYYITLSGVESYDNKIAGFYEKLSQYVNYILCSAHDNGEWGFYSTYSLHDNYYIVEAFHNWGSNESGQGNGIYLKNVAGTRVGYAYVTENRLGLSVQDSNAVNIYSSEGSGNTYWDLCTWDSTNVTLSDNDFDDICKN